ncbi:MAG: HNH endonuclease [Alphaproteobacteria bacterium]|nr:HNH endonuclease [Alphaproteobacteria bacterium]
MSRLHKSLTPRQWVRTRQAILERDDWRCRACGAYGNEVDHVRPLHKGGDPWEPANLQTLCRSCHIAKTARENRRPMTPAESRWRMLVAKSLAEEEAFE